MLGYFRYISYSFVKPISSDFLEFGFSQVFAALPFISHLYNILFTTFDLNETPTLRRVLFAFISV